MRQAIEEGFILDVLKNYTPYKLPRLPALSSGGREWDEQEVERGGGPQGDHALGAPAPLQHRPEGGRSWSSTPGSTWPRCEVCSNLVYQRGLIEVEKAAHRC